MVRKSDGLRRELADGGFHLNVIYSSCPFHHAFYGQSQVRVINAQQSMNVVRTVESIHSDVLVLITVVVKLIDGSVCLDGNVALFGKFSVEADFSG